MTLNGIISTSLTGLFTNQAALQATSNNIANVNTEGYSRVRVVTEANTVQGQTAGVTISEIERVVDEFLVRALRTSQSNTAEFGVQREFHDRLQGVLGDPASDSSLSARIDQLFSSVADLTLNPADVLRRQQMLSEMESFFDQLTLYEEQIQNLRGEASSQMAETVNEINGELKRIHELNPLLIAAEVTGDESSGLEGQLNLALSNLSELVDINVTRNPNGSIAVATSDGYPLVDASLRQLEYDAPGIVDAGTNFPTVNIYRVDAETLEQASSTNDLTSHVRSGKLAGLIDMRDTQLMELAVSLGELSARVMDQFNSVQNAYSAVPAPNDMTGKQTLVDGSHPTGFSGMTTFAVVDGSNQLVDSVTIDFDDTTTYPDMDAVVAAVNTALGGNATMALTDGVLSFSADSPANGVVIADDPTTPSDRAGRGFSHFFGMSDLVSASEDGIFETGLDGTEDHNLSGTGAMEFRVTDASGKELATITVNDTGTTFQDMINELGNVSGLGAYFSFALDSDGQLSWTETSSFDGLNLDLMSDTTELGSTGVSFGQAFGLDDQHRVNAARDVTIDPAIVTDPNRLSLSVFDTTGAVGDVVLTDGDQRGALAFQALGTTLVKFDEAGELKASEVTLGQYVSRFLGNAGLQAQRAQTQEEDNQALQDELFQRNSDISGVNMDEELANLVVYQNAYSAAAKVLSTAQELYDSLLAAV